MATLWGCVGAGHISSDFFTAIKENLSSDDHKFVAVAARDLTRAQKFADAFGFEKAYGCYDDLASDSDIEIVYIGTNHPNHAELSIKMMKAGKNVLCEKPLAMNLKQVKQMITTAKDNGVFFMEGLWTLFLPAYQQIKKELSENSLGNIRLVRAEVCLPTLRSYERFRTPELGGGGSYSFGVYPVALACMVFKEMPISIVASGNLTSEGVDETLCFTLKYRNGGMLNAFTSISVTGENTAAIYGDQGMIKIGSPMWTPTELTTPSGFYQFPLKEGTYNYPNSAAFQFEAREVRNYLKSGVKEAMEVPHHLSEMIATIMDEIRRQIGYSASHDADN